LFSEALEQEKDRVQQQNVAIIGASAAGLYAAYLLAQKGVPVQVYEESGTIGPPARTLIVTSQIVPVLGFVPTEAIVNRIEHIELFSPQAAAQVSLAQPDLIIEREKLIRLLAERARQAGAEIILGQRFLGFQGDGDGLTLQLQDRQADRLREVRTGKLLGADGVTSQVAGAIHRDSYPSVSIVQAKVVLPPGTEAHTVQVWFNLEDTRFFYWLIPESPDCAVVGLIAETQAQARARLNSFLAAHRLEATGYQAAQVSTHRFNAQPWTRVGEADVFLVGDAAGQVKVTTVGGVVTGLRGARAAANALLRHGDYAGELRGLKRELDLHLVLRKMLDRFANADYDALLRLLNRQARGILEARTRDEMARTFWRLALAQPQWIMLVARALVYPSRKR
jgi:flavin-dependent dehydrogenase